MDSLLPEFSIVVKVDLGIHCHDLAIRGFGQRVHLNHGTVTLDERVINGLDLLFGHGRRLSASELHLLGDGLGPLHSFTLQDGHLALDTCLFFLLLGFLFVFLYVHTLQVSHDDRVEFLVNSGTVVMRLLLSWALIDVPLYD